MSCLTGLNAANQNHLNELHRFQFKYFVQWPRVFFTSNLSGWHITKKNPVIFPYYKTFKTLFFFETSLKKKKQHRDVIVKMRDFFTNRHRRNVWKALAMLWNCAWNFLITMPWQSKFNISFKSVCVNWAIVSREHLTSSQLNEMFSLYISSWLIFTHDFIRKLMFCSANFKTKKNIDVRFQLTCLSNISFNIITCSGIRLRATVKFAYVLNSTCP